MPPSTEPLRLVQVGAGSMGRSWLEALAASDQVELVGLVDLDQATARRAAEDLGAEVEVSDDLGPLLDRVAADAVLNVTIPTAHAEVAITALLRGLPVLGEKPLAESVSAGLSMIAAAELSGQLLAVSQSRRYWRNLTALRAQIAQLGALGTLSCEFFRAPHFGGFRDEMDHPLLIDMAIHQFDLARDLTGGEPVAVYCDSYNPRWSWYAGDAAAQAVFELTDGVRFTFTGSWCSPGLETSWNGSWRVSGEGGTAIWDGDGEPSAGDADGRPLLVPVQDEPEQIAGSLAEFVTSVRTGTAPSGEARSNVLSLAMVEAATQSARERRRVLLAEVLEQAHADAVAQEARPEVREVLASWGSVHDVVGRARTDPSPAP